MFVFTRIKKSPLGIHLCEINGFGAEWAFLASVGSEQPGSATGAAC